MSYGMKGLEKIMAAAYCTFSTPFLYMYIFYVIIMNFQRPPKKKNGKKVLKTTLEII